MGRFDIWLMKGGVCQVNDMLGYGYKIYDVINGWILEGVQKEQSVIG